MEHLSEAQVATLRAALDAERGALHRQISADRGDVADNLDTSPGDVEDGAALEAGRFQARQRLGVKRASLAEVDAALARMEDGSYGLCEELDEPIPFRRLELRPTTRHSVAALEAIEADGGVVDPTGYEPIAY